MRVSDPVSSRCRHEVPSHDECPKKQKVAHCLRLEPFSSSEPKSDSHRSNAPETPDEVPPNSSSNPTHAGGQHNRLRSKRVSWHSDQNVFCVLVPGHVAEDPQEQNFPS